MKQVTHTSEYYTRRTLKILGEILVVLVSLVFLYPIVIVFMNSVKPYGEIITDLLAIPKTITTENYQKVLGSSNYFSSLMNTVSYVLLFVPVVSTLSCMAGYMIGRTNDRKSKLILGLFMLSMAIPGMTTLLPLFTVLGKLGLVNTRIGYALVYIPMACPSYVFFYSAHVASIPRELEEAAVMDGCTLPRCFVTIIYPLCFSVTAMVSVLLFLGVWNDYLLPSMLFRDEALHTVSMMLTRFQSEYGTKWDMMLTCASLVLIPSLTIYVFAQRFIMRGMMMGAVKG